MGEEEVGTCYERKEKTSFDRKKKKKKRRNPYQVRDNWDECKVGQLGKSEQRCKKCFIKVRLGTHREQKRPQLMNTNWWDRDKHSEKLFKWEGEIISWLSKEK